MPGSSNPYYQGPVTDHFDGTRFFNPDGIEPLGFSDVLRWQFGGGRMTWPKRIISPHKPAKPARKIDGDAIRVTMVGHASLLVQVAGINILTDPVWSERVSPFSFAGPKRVVAPGIAFADLPPIDLVLVTHNHYDHMDLLTLAALHAAHRPEIVTPLGNDAIIRRRIADARIRVLDWGEAASVSGIRIIAEPCHHWSARGTRDRRMALWSAFVLETPAGRIYHIGDTGFHEGINYRAVGEKYDGFRLALLPFGAYEPRWFMRGQHQNPQEAVEGMRLCRASFVAGHHWGTFQLTDEGFGQPVEALHAALDEHGIARENFPALSPGQVFDVPPMPA